MIYSLTIYLMGFITKELLLLTDTKGVPGSPWCLGCNPFYCIETINTSGPTGHPPVTLSQQQLMKHLCLQTNHQTYGTNRKKKNYSGTKGHSWDSWFWHRRGNMYSSKIVKNCPWRTYLTCHNFHFTRIQAPLKKAKGEKVKYQQPEKKNCLLYYAPYRGNHIHIFSWYSLWFCQFFGSPSLLQFCVTVHGRFWSTVHRHIVVLLFKFASSRVHVPSGCFHALPGSWWSFSVSCCLLFAK
jgi:hypothetical protein